MLWALCRARLSPAWLSGCQCPSVRESRFKLGEADFQGGKDTGKRGPRRVGLAPLDPAQSWRSYASPVCEGFLGFAALFAQAAQRPGQPLVDLRRRRHIDGYC